MGAKILLIISDENSIGYGLPAYLRASALLERNIWTFKRRFKISQGSKCLIYIAGKRQNHGRVVASCTLASSRKPFSEYKANVSRDFILAYSPKYFVELKDVHMIDGAPQITKIRSKLSFISNPNSKSWGASLMGSVRYLSDRDFQILTGLSTSDSNPEHQD